MRIPPVISHRMFCRHAPRPPRSYEMPVGYIAMTCVTFAVSGIFIIFSIFRRLSESALQEETRLHPYCGIGQQQISSWPHARTYHIRMLPYMYTCAHTHAHTCTHTHTHTHSHTSSTISLAFLNRGENMCSNQIYFVQHVLVRHLHIRMCVGITSKCMQ